MHKSAVVKGVYFKLEIETSDVEILASGSVGICYTTHRKRCKLITKATVTTVRESLLLYQLSKKFECVYILSGLAHYDYDVISRSIAPTPSLGETLSRRYVKFTIYCSSFSFQPAVELL